MYTVTNNYSPLNRNTTEILRYESKDSNVLSDYDSTYNEHSNLQFT